MQPLHHKTESLHAPMANHCFLMAKNVQLTFPGLVTVAQGRAETSLTWGSELKNAQGAETEQLTPSLSLLELHWWNPREPVWFFRMVSCKGVQRPRDSTLQTFTTGVPYSYEHSHYCEQLYAQDCRCQDWPAVIFPFSSQYLNMNSRVSLERSFPWAPLWSRWSREGYSHISECPSLQGPQLQPSICTAACTEGP